MDSQFRLDSDGDLRADNLEQLGWVEHGFGTRNSREPAQALATLKQVHGATVIDATGRCGALGEGDALVSSAPGDAVAVRTADCVSILLADDRHRVVAAVHAGWRGTVKEIAVATLQRMREDYGTDPGDVWAAIGPAIGDGCFEVGPEVAREFARWRPELQATEQKEHLNLEWVNAEQLVGAGVPEDQIAAPGRCTMCEPELFFSYRREREQAGRMLSWIRRRD